MFCRVLISFVCYQIVINVLRHRHRLIHDYTFRNVRLINWMSHKFFSRFSFAPIESTVLTTIIASMEFDRFIFDIYKFSILLKHRNLTHRDKNSCSVVFVFFRDDSMFGLFAFYCVKTHPAKDCKKKRKWWNKYEQKMKWKSESFRCWINENDDMIYM